MDCKDSKSQIHKSTVINRLVPQIFGGGELYTKLKSKHMENIKNSKGEILPQPYLDLARMRREQQNQSHYFRLFHYDFEETKLLSYAFDLKETPEGNSFWVGVKEGLTPEIPAASLAELEEWRKEKGIAELQPAEPDWKAMYEAEKEKAEYYEHLYHQADEINKQAMYSNHEAELQSPDRNWVAECVPFQKCPVCDGYGEVRPIWNKDAQQPTYVKCSVCEGNKVILMYNA